MALTFVSHYIETLRTHRPLVHNITNYVVMQTTANALLAIGASPIMAHAPEEMDEITACSSALVLNLGTLSTPWIASMHRALDVARRLGLPVVIDPVGAGASQLRTETAHALLERSSNAVLRGNASEIMALAGVQHSGKGVDSADHSSAATTAAAILAKRYGCVVCVSGETDWVIDNCASVSLTGGSSLMAHVTGMGCTASALVGAMAGVMKASWQQVAATCSFAASDSTVAPLAKDTGAPLFFAAVAAAACMAAAGSMAAQEARGPGSFSVAFLDALYRLEYKDVTTHIKMQGLCQGALSSSCI